jgi:hypothetical protein
LEQNEPFSTLKILICRKYSFLKLTQFSQENNIMDVPASNTDGLFSRYIGFYTLTDQAYLEKMSIPYHDN